DAGEGVEGAKTLVEAEHAAVEELGRLNPADVGGLAACRAGLGPGVGVAVEESVGAHHKSFGTGARLVAGAGEGGGEGVAARLVPDAAERGADVGAQGRTIEDASGACDREAEDEGAAAVEEPAVARGPGVAAEGGEQGDHRGEALGRIGVAAAAEDAIEPGGE